ncbi:MAG: prepilin-type N-terminal cleavage/methylation domain-containing protein [Acidobacteriota bacterium]|nr:prepilin-type N-terminal cleavage/methylation domain-containing protein [Blastocatellia bacterium]MDW8413045.1 prepilin-type N-terminal cleavage/methylation domain-containing protein [Acidobacteriota bacterium]
MNPKVRGFSLVEMLLVVVLISIIAAIAVPNLLAARRAAHEGRAIAHIRTLVDVQFLFYSSKNRFAIPDELFTGNFLGAGSFQRNAPSASGTPTSGATEVLSDGFYDYSFRYTTDSQGFTLDVDPKPPLRGRYRWFRYRIHRTTAGGTVSGSMGVILWAMPSTAPPPNSAYRPLQ